VANGCRGDFEFVNASERLHIRQRRREATTKETGATASEAELIDGRSEYRSAHRSAAVFYVDGRSVTPFHEHVEERMSAWPHVCTQAPAHKSTGLPPRSVCVPSVQSETARRSREVESAVRIALVMVFATPHLIKLAQQRWLNTSRFMAVGNADDAAHHIAFAPSQRQMHGITYGTSSNHDGDNRPLQAIRMANRTLRPFEWLVVGDADTAFELPELTRLLTTLWADEAGAQYLAHVHPPGARRTCGHMRLCREEGKARTTDPAIAPSEWAYGGVGYAISRRLLDAISPAQWAACERDLVNWGGDARVAKCLHMHTGTLPTNLPGLGTELSIHQSKSKFSVGTTRQDMEVLNDYLQSLDDRLARRAACRNPNGEAAACDLSVRLQDGMADQ